MESEVRKDINSVGLDPAIGFLHELDESKEPLVYDMQELFRWLIDLSVIQLLEEKKLEKSDFIVPENYHIRLKEQTAKAPFKGGNATYQTILFGNIQGVAHFVIGKSKALSFDIPKLAVKRNDDLDVQQRILTMTPAERRALG